MKIQDDEMTTAIAPGAMGGRHVVETNFRRDINGLRAWAVVGVILYHFGIPGFTGGFAGVDVFFVISGFLMTQIICTGLVRGDFSLWKFYVARAVRIVPALLVLCATLLGLGWIALLPTDYKLLASHTAYSLTFLSNIEYWNEIGYFNTNSHEKWLLHTWSLAVEWQFYIFLPVILLGLWRAIPGALAQRRALVFLSCVSFMACVYTTALSPSAAFFLLPTRAWEMLAGGLVFLASQRFDISPAWRNLIPLTGLILITASFTLFDAESLWPGWRALVPVVGAVLVLIARQSSFWTDNAVAQWLGDRSYSLYLWHWPACVLLTYASWNHDAPAIAAALLAAIALGAISYAWVERPSRRVLQGWRIGFRASALGAMLTTILLAATTVWYFKGVNGRFPPNIELAAAAAGDINPQRDKCHQSAGTSSPACLFGGVKPKLFVVGDSHAAAVISSVIAARADGDAGVVQLSYAGCVYVPAMRQLQPHRFGANNDCQGFNDWVTQKLATAPTMPVLLIGRYARSAFGEFERDPDSATPEVYFGAHRYTSTTPAFLDEFSKQLTDTACALAKTRKVYMMRPIPEMPVSVPEYVSRRMAWSLDAHLSITMAQYMRRNAWVWKAQDEARDRCGIVIVDPTARLCHDGICESTYEGRPLYSDHGHLNEYANKLLAPVFAPVHTSH